MKNISLALNIVLLIAVGVLYYVEFGTSGGSNEAQDPGIMKKPEYAVAYINSDSVLQNYEYFEELQQELSAKQQQLEKDYQNRAAGLQRELTDYQRNLNSLTIGQAKALEEDLLKKQQNLRLYQESLSQELLREEARISQKLYDKITSYLREYSIENDLELVVKFNQGSDVLYANDSMDITKQVIKGLNEAYNNPEEGEKTANATDTTKAK
ncbi:MAG: OmpH family outer membrane protein [Fulvivirga sp.]|nr:OmpH family outer membrane protein [Fulvivirga sp.]